MKVRLHKFSATALVATSLSATAFIFAQNDKSPSPSPSPAPNPPAQPVATADRSAEKSEKQVPPQSAAAPAPAAAQPKTVAAAPAKPDAPRAVIGLAGHDAKEHTAKKYMGHHLRGNDGRDLGSVKDFLLDPHTGRVDFAVISSGGIVGMGDKLRLVPTAALKPTQKKDEFTVDVSEEQWKQLVALADDEFKSGEVTIPDTQRRQIAQAFEHRTAPAADSVYTASLSSRLVRASELAGRDVQTGQGKLGEMEAIVLDLEAGTAQALVDPNHDFTGTRAKLLVPFNQFTVSGGKRPEVTTLLTRSDFQQLHTGSGMATGLASSSAGSTTPPQPVAQPNAAPSPSTSAVASTQPNASSDKPAPKSPDQAAPASSTPQQAVAANETPAKTEATNTTPAKSTSTVASTPQTGGEKSTAKSPDQAAPASSTPQQAVAANETPAQTQATNTTPAKSTSTVASTSQTGGEKSTAKSPDQAAPTPASTTPSASTKSAVATNESPAKAPAASADPTVASPTDRSGRMAATGKSPATKDENLTPTGQDSADSIPAGIDPALLATARAIRKALDEDPALARADVRVMPEEQRIVLRGRVNDQKTKTAIIEKATSEVKGWKIDDQISIDNR